MLLDDRVTIATPEGVSLELVLAGVGSRFVARLLDTVIQIAIIFALVIIVAATSAPGFVRAVMWILLFLVVFAYDIPFEVWNGGRTVGKIAAGIRVVGDLGEPIGFFTSAIRTIVRIIDFLPALYVVGVITMIANWRDQRVGDLMAGTLVVRERFPGLAKDATAPPTVAVDAVATWDVSALDQVDLATIHQFLDRRLALPIPVRAHFASELAARVAPKVVGAPYGTHPEYLLEGVVIAKQARA